MQELRVGHYHIQTIVIKSLNCDMVISQPCLFHDKLTTLRDYALCF